jgi:hypothetical protein
MSGPAWLAPAVAGLMLAVAACCVVRLAIWRRFGRGIEPDADTVHVLMGVAMAGMLEPRLSPVPPLVWRAVFAAAAAWFAWRAIRARSSRRAQPGRWRCAHPAPHAVECVAMIYMLLPGHPADTSGISMPAMSGPGGANPALALILAMFMLGYVLWTADQLATFSRALPATAGIADQAAAVQAAAVQAAAVRAASAPAAAVRAASAPAATAALAPRLAACYKITMSIAMGYMLITML